MSESQQPVTNNFEDWLKRLLTAARAYALSLDGVDPSLAEYLAANLTSDYAIRNAEGKSPRGPLPDDKWKTELRRRRTTALKKRAKLRELVEDDLRESRAEYAAEESELASQASALFDASVARFATEKQHAAFKRYKQTDKRAKPAPDERKSREAFRKLLKRAETAGTAGLVILAAEDSEKIPHLLAPQNGVRGLLSMDVMKSFDDIRRRKLSKSDLAALEPGFARLWEHAVKTLSSVLRDPSKHEFETLTQVPTCFYMMFAASRIYETNFEAAYHDARDRFRKTGLLDNPHTNRQLSTIGAYAGVDQHLADFLRSSHTGALELSQMLLFADNGVASSALDFTTVVRGEPLSFKNPPPRALVRVLDYACTCVQDDLYCNEPLLLMVLNWLREVFESNCPLTLKDVNRVCTLTKQYEKKLSAGLLRPLYDVVRALAVERQSALGG
ncbi:MAG: hypothetical protein NXI31_05965 [bacterium]|nr:hypothetical protein [bacterium]